MYHTGIFLTLLGNYPINILLGLYNFKMKLMKIDLLFPNHKHCAPSRFACSRKFRHDLSDRYQGYFCDKQTINVQIQVIA